MAGRTTLIGLLVFLLFSGGVTALCTTLLTRLSSIPSGTVFEKKVELSPTVSARPRFIDDRAYNESPADIVVETKIELPLIVSPSVPFIVFYAYNEYHTYEKPIDVIAASIVDLPVGSCRDEVKRAADVYALSLPMMMAFALIESRCRPREKTGSYIGLFQLSQYEFNLYGRSGGDVYNMRDNAMAAAHKIVVEAIDFEHAVGRYPTPFDRYCIHQQGLEGCIQHQARPDRIAWKSMCATEEGRTKGEKWCRLAIWRNVPRDLKASIKGGVEALTSDAFLDIWRGKVVSFTKIMMEISEARAETPIIPEKPRIQAKPPQTAEAASVAETPIPKPRRLVQRAPKSKPAAVGLFSGWFAPKVEARWVTARKEAQR